MPTRIITLTGARPIRIEENEWPVVAQARSPAPASFPAIPSAGVTVRQHADGRRLVYGFHRSPGAEYPDRRAGIALDAGEDDTELCLCIGEVCSDIEHLELVQPCIQALRAEVA